MPEDIILYSEKEISLAWAQTTEERQALRWSDFLLKLKENKIKKDKE